MDIILIYSNMIFQLMFYLSTVLALAAPVRERLVSEDYRLQTSSDRFLC